MWVIVIFLRSQSLIDSKKKTIAVRFFCWRRNQNEWDILRYPMWWAGILFVTRYRLVYQKEKREQENENDFFVCSGNKKGKQTVVLFGFGCDLQLNYYGSKLRMGAWWISQQFLTISLVLKLRKKKTHKIYHIFHIGNSQQCYDSYC